MQIEKHRFADLLEQSALKPFPHGVAQSLSLYRASARINRDIFQVS